MIDILFRGKAVEEKAGVKICDWVYGSLIRTTTDEVYIFEAGTDEKIAVNPATVGQDTGLKDRGKYKIFEGDILQDPDNATLLKVEWSEEEASFYAYEIDGCWCYGANEMVCFDVVGNKWDDPELLRKIDRGE